MNIKSFKKLFSITAFIFLLIFYISYSSLFNLGFKELNIDIKSLSIVPKTIILIGIEFTFLIILWFLYRKELKKEIIDYKENFNSYFRLGIKVWAIGLLVMMTSNLILYFITHSSPSNENNIRTILKSMPVYTLFATMIFAPFSEEIVFRKALKKCFSSNMLFIISSGLIFGGLHVLSSKNLIEFLYIIPYGTFGVAFAYLYSKTKNIFSSMTIHILHNSILVIAALFSLGVV